MTTKEKQDMLLKLVQDLGEHFEAVQLLVSWQNDENKTSMISQGGGNYYARIGMAKNFVESDMAFENAEALAKQIKLEE